LIITPVRPSVSVVIPAFNAASYLPTCLDSVFSQQTEANMEVIVVDDGSTDGTRECVLAYPPAICLAQSNKGPAAARNVGMERGGGEFVAFLDADDLWPEDKLQRQVELLLRHDDAAMCFGDCRQFGDGVEPAGTLFEQLKNEVASWGSGPYLPKAYERLLTANFITTGSVVVRRDRLMALGGFDARLRLVEDLELWLRVARQAPILWTSEVCLLRRRHADNLSTDQQAMSLAYLGVLARQRTAQSRGEVSPALDFTGLMAREYTHMADRALLARRPGEATNWAWRGLKTRPSLGGAWRLAQGAGQWLARGVGGG
jgi:glycosyltransferase involved in cell wall biosynthesis